MKTTIDIADDLLTRARSVAHRDSVTLRELIVEGLRSELERRETPDRVEIHPHVIKGRGRSREIPWERMREAMYGDEGSRFQG